MSRTSKWRLTETAVVRLIIAFTLVFVWCYLSRAQEESGPADEAVVVADPPSEAVQTALLVLESRDPQSPAELIHAVNILRKLGAYEEARSYLDRVTSQNLDARALLEVYRQIGTGELTPLANDVELMPEARDFVHRVFAAVRGLRRSPERMRQLISQLANPDAERRRALMAELAAIGGHAVPPLLDAFRRPPSDVTTTQLESSFARIGNDAEDALIAALGSPDQAVQAVAARALGHVGSKQAAVHLLRPFHVGSDELKHIANQSLHRLGVSPPDSPEASAVLLRERATDCLNGQAPKPAGIDGTSEIWTWSVEADNVTHHVLTASEAAAVVAARLARDVYELSQSEENAQFLLVSRLQTEKLLGGVDALLPNGVGSAFDFGETIGLAAVGRALDHCLQQGYDPAAIGAAELVGDLFEDAPGHTWSPLTRALKSPNRRVRYAAARAIMKVDPRDPYAGSSTMLNVLVDLSEAGGRPNAIVATPRTDIRERLSGMLGSLGFSVFSTGGGRPCLKEALRASDYDVVLLSDSTNSPTATETIQQLRKDPRGKLIPVILLAREDLTQQSKLLASLDELVIAMPEFGDLQTLTSTLEEVEQLADGISVPPARRLEQAADALSWLTHLAQYSKTYPWYDLMRAKKVALDAVSQPALTATALDLLGYLGDESAQRTLVDTASAKTLPSEHRQRAANAFAEAVLRRGLLLRSAEVYTQYDRYNASETDDNETQEILGQILDVIETQTKPTSILRQTGS